MKKLVLIVMGALLSLLGLGFAAGGALGLSTLGSSNTALQATLGDFRADTPVLVVNGFSLDQQTPIPEDKLALIVAAQSRSGKELFLGFAPSERVREYLRGAPYTVIKGLGSSEGATTASVPGDTALAPPGDQAFWSSSGTGTTAEAEWDPTATKSSLVVMNADASTGVAATITAGLRSPLLRTGSIALLVAGALALALGLLLVVLGVRAKARQAVPAGNAGAGATGLAGEPGEGPTDLFEPPAPGGT